MSFVLHRPFLGLFQKEYSSERRCNLCMKCLTTEIKWNKKAKNVKGEKKKGRTTMLIKLGMGAAVIFA